MEEERKAAVETAVSEKDSVIEDGKFFAAIGYVSILFLVPLILKRDNKFALFHGKQGLVLFVLEVAACIIGQIKFIGELVFMFGFVVCGILSLVGIVKVLMNEYWEMPVISDIASKIEL